MKFLILLVVLIVAAPTVARWISPEERNKTRGNVVMRYVRRRPLTVFIAVILLFIIGSVLTALR